MKNQERKITQQSKHAMNPLLVSKYKNRNELDFTNHQMLRPQDYGITAIMSMLRIIRTLTLTAVDTSSATFIVLDTD